MATARDVEQDLAPARVEHGRHDCDVWEMRAAVVRGIEHEHVARPHLPRFLADDRLDRPVHAAEMNRHVRGIGDEIALAVEDRAREIEPLLDIDRLRREPQRLAHLLGNRHEEIVEDFEQHGIRLRPKRLAAPGRHARKQEIIPLCYLQRPAVLDHDGLMRFDDERRAGDALPDRERLA